MNDDEDDPFAREWRLFKIVVAAMVVLSALGAVAVVWFR